MKKIGCLIGGIILASAMLTACGNKAAEEIAAAFDNTSLDIRKIDVDSYVEKLGEYNGLTVEIDKKMEITDKSVDQYIAYVLDNMGVQGEKTEVSRPIQDGDVVSIDYIGTKDGVPFDGGTGSYDLTIGSGQFIPGFESGLIGHEKGEVVVLPLTFPENYGNADLAGQNVEFEVTINEIFEQSAPVLTDDYVVGLGIPDVTDVASFREYIKNNLEADAENRYVTGKREALLNAIYEASNFTEMDMPENLLNYYIERTVAEDKNTAQSYGTSLEEYVQVMYDKSYDEYMEEAKAAAAVQLKNVMLCQKIAMLEGVTVSDDELDKELMANATQYGYKTINEFLIDKAVSKEDFRNYLIEIKVVDKLLESATFVEK